MDGRCEHNVPSSAAKRAHKESRTASPAPGQPMQGRTPALEPTPYSLRSCLASASGRGSPRAFLRHEVASCTARDRHRSGDLAWCGATCSRTGGASLATAGSQALGKTISCEWPTISSAGNGREGEGHGSLGIPHRDAGGARAPIRPQRQHGMEGRSGRLNGAPPHPLTLPVYRGLLPRLVGETGGTWSAGFAL
jgi:hypothetical protein